MKKLLFTALVTLTFHIAFAQIDSTEKSVQAVFYGNAGDWQEYKVTYNTLKMKGNDTLSNESVQYFASLKVLDVKDKEYVMEWKIRDYFFQTDIPVLKALSEFNNGLKIVYTTNELGEYQDVTNYPEIKERLEQYTAHVKKSLLSDEQSLFETTIRNILGSKEAFTRNVIQDIYQIHNFYGIKYLLHDTIRVDVQVPDNFDGTPIDAGFVSYLEDLGKDTYTLISEQTVTPEAIDKAAKKYLHKVLPAESQADIEKYDFTQMKQVSTLASQMHESGWLIMSMNSKVNSTLGYFKRDLRIIEIQSGNK